MKHKFHYQGKYSDGSKSRSMPLLSHWWLLALLWLSSAIPEVVLHIATATGKATMINSGLILGALFAIVPALIVFTLISLMPWRKINIAVCISYSALYALIAGAQLVYYSIFGVYFSAYSMVNGAAAAQFWKVALMHIGMNLHWIAILLLPLLFFSIFSWRMFRFEGLRSWYLSLVPAVLAVAMQFLLIGALPWFGGTEDMSAYNLYHYNSDSYLSINKLGLLTGFRLDLTRYFTGNEPEGTLNLDATMPSINWPFMTTQPGSSESSSSQSHPSGVTVPDTEPIITEPPIDTSPNILDIDFENLIANESDDTIKQMHQYFSQRTASSKNEYTGIFEGCNLIMITAEGFSAAMIDPERTPTLYKMMSEGIYLENYYVPLWGVSTTDGEYAFLTGTIPKSGVWSFKRSADNAMPLTMSKQLIEQGYNAYAYHGHTYTYYSRDQYLTNLGYYYKGYGGDSYGIKENGLKIKYVWPESDYEVVDITTDEYVNNGPFVTYYMTISGHLEYNFSGNTMALRNKDLVKDEPYSTSVQAYFACQLEFEKSLELLLTRLEEAGVLDNTVIVITADHYPYGLTDEEYSELLGKTVTQSDLELYKNGCIIYKGGMEGQRVTELCSHLDLLPTLSNLFGLEFDSRLYMGRDIFSDAMALVMFQNRSWITEYVSYNADTKKYTYFSDAEIPQEYLDYIKSEVSNRFTISRRILEKDYWRILFPDE